MQEMLSSGKSGDLPLSVSTLVELGALIKAVRKAQGMTQIDVAGLGGHGNRFIVDLEKGKETVQKQKAMDMLGLLGLEMVVRKRACNESKRQGRAHQRDVGLYGQPVRWHLAQDGPVQLQL